MGELLEYGALFVAVGVLGLIGFSVFSPQQPAGDDSEFVEFDSQGDVVQSQQNYQYFSQQAGQQPGSECGNLRDTANVQHLSHHPDRYVDCLRQVDPAFLKQATGQSYEEIVGASSGGGGMEGHHG